MMVGLGFDCMWLKSVAWLGFRLNIYGIKNHIYFNKSDYFFQHLNFQFFKDIRTSLVQ